MILPFPQHREPNTTPETPGVKSVPLSSQKQVRQAPHRHGHLRLSLERSRDQCLVDPKPLMLVKRILPMTIDGYSPYQIASKLKEEKSSFRPLTLPSTMRACTK